MNDSKSAASSRRESVSPFVEDDGAETIMEYGRPQTVQPYVFVGLVWAGFLLGLTTYMVQFYFPDLAEWRVW